MTFNIISTFDYNLERYILQTNRIVESNELVVIENNDIYINPEEFRSDNSYLKFFGNELPILATSMPKSVVMKNISNTINLSIYGYMKLMSIDYPNIDKIMILRGPSKLIFYDNEYKLSLGIDINIDIGKSIYMNTGIRVYRNYSILVNGDYEFAANYSAYVSGFFTEENELMLRIVNLGDKNIHIKSHENIAKLIFNKTEEVYKIIHKCVNFGNTEFVNEHMTFDSNNRIVFRFKPLIMKPKEFSTYRFSLAMELPENTIARLSCSDDIILINDTIFDSNQVVLKLYNFNDFDTEVSKFYLNLEKTIPFEQNYFIQ